MSKQLALMDREPTRPHPAGMLDERTKQVGRLGLVRARAALADASRRAADRDAERLARRETELANRAEAARRAAGRRQATPGDERPTTHAA